MGLHNDQACSDRLAYGLSSRFEKMENLSEFPRSKAEIQGQFAGVVLALSRIDAAGLTVVETNLVLKTAPVYVCLRI